MEQNRPALGSIGLGLEAVRDGRVEKGEDWHFTDRLRAEQGKGDPFAAAIRATRMPMLITDPRLDDNPIVFANDAFLELTGYSRDEITGKNCRFLQGPLTDPRSVDRLRNAVNAGEDLTIDLLNYRKDGSTFWNALYMSPVINEAGELHYFFASQLNVTDRVEAQSRIRRDKSIVESEVERRTLELQQALEAKTILLHEVDHRVKNNLQMISSLLLLQANSVIDGPAKQALLSTLARVEALGAMHRKFHEADNVTRFNLGEFTREIATDLVGANGRDDIRLDLDLDHVEIPAEKAAPLALLINELVTNSLKHAFGGGRAGRILVAIKRKSDGFHIRVEDDGIGMNGHARPSATSSRASSKPLGRDLMRVLARQLRATTDWKDADPGTRVEIAVPAGEDMAQ